MIAEPRCSERFCKHFGGINPAAGRDERKQFLVCPAYPNGIPERIAFGDDTHVLVAPDQVGATVYERGVPE